MEGEAACWMCRYFAETDMNKVGICQRYPPVLVDLGKSGEVSSWVQPIVDSINCCGEYKGITLTDGFFDVYSDGQTSWPADVEYYTKRQPLRLVD